MKKLNLLLLTAVVAVLTFGFINKSQKAPKAKEGFEIGDKAPELKFNNPEGKPIALSSLKGKVVLIDFWASWCGPCRMENPALVGAYNKYKNVKFKKAKGFTIFSVSLDQDKNRWVGAIAQDQLSWEYHVSDLGGWSSQPAKLYRVNSIPMNYLIDENGIIKAKSLRGAQLEAALEALANEKL